MKFETLKSETIYKGRVFSVTKEYVKYPSGQIVQLDIVNHPGAVTIVPIDDQGQIWFIRQYRHSAGGVILELPAGTLEFDETPEACAAREIQEEIGMSASKIEKIGEFFMAPGYSTEYLYIFLASDLHPGRLPGDEDEIIKIEKISILEAYNLAETGQIYDSKTLASLLLSRRALLK